MKKWNVALALMLVLLFLTSCEAVSALQETLSKPEAREAVEAVAKVIPPIGGVPWGQVILWILSMIGTVKVAEKRVEARRGPPDKEGKIELQKVIQEAVAAQAKAARAAPQ